MTIFIIVIIWNIIFLFLQTNLYNVDISGWNLFFLPSHIVLLLIFESLLLIFSVFFALLWGFRYISTWQKWLWIFSFEVLSTRFFDYWSLSLHFSRHNIRKTVAPETIKVCVPNYDTWSQACFGFGVDCLLYQLFKISRCAILLF